MGSIVDKFIDELQRSLAERKVEIRLTPAARAHLAELGYDPVYGARPLSRIIRERVEDPLASEILFGKLTKGGSAVVDAPVGKSGEDSGKGKQLTFIFKSEKKA